MSRRAASSSRPARALPDLPGMGLLALALLGACAGPGGGASSQPTSRPDSQPTSQPSGAAGGGGATADAEARAVAEAVVAYHGGRAGWRGVDTITLEFNGWRRLFWDVVGGKVRVESLDPESDWQVLVHDIHADRSLLRHPAPAPEAPARSAKGMWINDFYWLLVPLKVLDEGVTLSLDPRQADDPEGVVRLRLSFTGVGLTPQNQYVLHVERATGKVQRWDFYRTSTSDPASWRFEGYTDVGPLRLSLSRPVIQAPRSIEMTGVTVGSPVPAGAWTATEKILR